MIMINDNYDVVVDDDEGHKAPQNGAFDQGLQCLPLVLQFPDTPTGKMELFKFSE